MEKESLSGYVNILEELLNLHSFPSFYHGGWSGFPFLMLYIHTDWGSCGDWIASDSWRTEGRRSLCYVIRSWIWNIIMTPNSFWGETNRLSKKKKTMYEEFIPKVLWLNFRSAFAQAPVIPDLISISIKCLNNTLVNLMLWIIFLD